MSNQQTIHPDDLAVDRFAAAMKAKLAQARAKGRSGWYDKTDCTQDHLSRLLRSHVVTGDPVDVANFAMFLHQRGEGISTAPESVVIRDLIELARQVNLALDDSEEMEGDHGRMHAIDGQRFDDVCEALHRLESLPDDKPGYTLGPASKAEWALRRVLGGEL